MWNFIFIIIIVITVPLILNFTIFKYSTDFTNGELTDWFTFFASYSGGIVGGLVAYFVAKLQIDSNRKDAKIKQLSYELPGYIMIQIELKRWYKIVSEVNDFKVNFINESGEVAFNNQLVNNFLDIDIDFKRDNWEKKWLIQDPVLLEELIVFEEMFNHTYSYLRKDFTDYIDQYKGEIKHIGKQVLMPEKARGKLDLELKVKKEAFDELVYIIQKIGKLQKAISNNIIHIREFIDNPKKYDIEKIKSTKDDFKVNRNDDVVESMHIIK